METIILTCKECGSEDLDREETYDLIENYHSSLACTCDNPQPDEIASEYDETITTTYKVSEGGYYDETGHWEGLGEDKEEIQKDTETIKETVNCQECFESASETDWTEELDGEPTEENMEAKVFCSKCEHEFDLKEALKRIEG